MTAASRFRRVLVAVGDSDDEADSVPVVIDLARAFGAEVLVLHLRERIVAAGGKMEQESIPAAMEFGERVAQGLVDAGVRAGVDVHSTTPDKVGDEILDTARDFGADLIVVGPHHVHGLHQRLFGDIGRALAHGSACPVLLMPSVAGRSQH